ncbi:MAG: hypothetical protein JWP89_2027 [Schlesneria sp.]|nr:hypothetical protein [Schlesneria sp.]
MGRPFRPQEMLIEVLFRGRRAPAGQSSGPLGLMTQANESQNEYSEMCRYLCSKTVAPIFHCGLRALDVQRVWSKL